MNRSDISGFYVIIGKQYRTGKTSAYRRTSEFYRIIREYTEHTMQLIAAVCLHIMHARKLDIFDIIVLIFVIAQ